MLLSTDFTGPSLAVSLAMDKCGEEVSAWVLVGVCFLAFCFCMFLPSLVWMFSRCGPKDVLPPRQLTRRKKALPAEVAPEQPTE